MCLDLGIHWEGYTWGGLSRTAKSSLTSSSGSARAGRLGLLLGGSAYIRVVTKYTFGQPATRSEKRIRCRMTLYVNYLAESWNSLHNVLRCLVWVQSKRYTSKPGIRYGQEIIAKNNYQIWIHCKIRLCQAQTASTSMQTNTASVWNYWRPTITDSYTSFDWNPFASNLSNDEIPTTHQTH